MRVAMLAVAMSLAPEACSQVQAGQSEIRSTFETGDDGWTRHDYGRDFVYVSPGSLALSPDEAPVLAQDGIITIERAYRLTRLGFASTEATALFPAEYLGDLSRFDGGRLSLEIRARASDAIGAQISSEDCAKVRIDFFRAGPNPLPYHPDCAAFQSTFLVTTDNTWQTISCSLPGSLNLVRVTKIVLTAEYSNSSAAGTLPNFETLNLEFDLDNVALTTPPPVVCTEPTEYGVGTPGTGGFVPTLATRGSALVPRSEFGLRAEHLLGGSPCAYALGFVPDDSLFLGTRLLVGIVRTEALIAGGHGPGGGTADFTIAIPDNRELLGTAVFAQVFALDGSTPGGLSASAGLRFVFCETEAGR